MKKKEVSAYARAGVDIDSKMKALDELKRMVKNTPRKGIIAGIGAFGGMFVSPGADHVLVASVDGVGTKIKVAVMANKHDTVGQDIVNHCVNDILVQGAYPLFFLDYVAFSRFDRAVFRQIMTGICRACSENDCALLGGETAELPGVYPEGEYDLVGMIVGSVSKEETLKSEPVLPGDMIIGLRSTGLHTNGYSLARKIIFEKLGLKITDTFPGLKRNVADVLLAVHRSYLRPVKFLQQKVKIIAMAHITGGGFTDNIPRVLSRNTSAVIDCSSWTPPHVFRFIQIEGKVSSAEMYRVFNMGIGFVIIVREKDASTAMSVLKEAGEKPVLIGYICEGRRQVILKGLK